MTLKTRSQLSVLVLALSAAGNANANLLINASFEAGNYTPGADFTRLGTGSTDITGWTVGGQGLDWHVIEGSTAHFGHNGVDGSRYAVDLSLDSSPAGSISQSFNTTIGALYRLSFLLGAPWFDTGVKVTVGSASQTFELSAQDQYGFPWSHESLEFTANGSTTTLLFESLGGGFWGPVLDNVSVTAVPDSTHGAVLAGVGFLGVASMRRRK